MGTWSTRKSSYQTQAPDQSIQSSLPYFAVPILGLFALRSQVFCTYAPLEGGCPSSTNLQIANNSMNHSLYELELVLFVWIVTARLITVDWGEASTQRDRKHGHRTMRQIFLHYRSNFFSDSHGPMRLQEIHALSATSSASLFFLRRLFYTLNCSCALHRIYNCLKLVIWIDGFDTTWIRPSLVDWNECDWWGSKHCEEAKTRTAVVLLSNDTPPEPYQWHDEKSNTSAIFVQGETSQTSLKLLGG